MRIQDTNKLLNEARVQRRAHSHEMGEFEPRGNRLLSALRSRGVQAGIVGGLAAVGVGLFLMSRRRNGQFSFDFGR